MPVESPETEDPDAFFEGESFQVQEVEDVEDWEDFLTLRAIWVVSRGAKRVRETDCFFPPPPSVFSKADGGDTIFSPPRTVGAP